MAFLDCESLASTLESLGTALEEPADVVRSYLLEFDLDSALEASDDDAADILLSLFPRRPRLFHGCYWFHLTRVPRGAFLEGILPRDLVVERVWRFLGRVAHAEYPDVDWSKFKREFERGGHGHGSHQYLLKGRIHTGPFAVLVRPTAFVPAQLCNHDYLSAPEVVDDICRGFLEAHKRDLLSAYHRSTRPHIVKFQRNECALSNTRIAIRYAYSAVHGRRLTLQDSTCLDCKGVVVPPRDVVRVEVLD